MFAQTLGCDTHRAGHDPVKVAGCDWVIAAGHDSENSGSHNL